MSLPGSYYIIPSDFAEHHAGRKQALICNIPNFSECQFHNRSAWFIAGIQD